MAVMFLPPPMSSSENAPPPAEKPKGPEHTELKQFKIEEEFFLDTIVGGGVGQSVGQ